MSVPINTQLPPDAILDEQGLAKMRKKMSTESQTIRDRLCDDLQYRAERAPLVRGEGHALLVGLPIVLGYSHKTRLKGQDALVNETASALAEVLRTLWTKVLPGRRVAPLLTSLRLDLALAAQPSEIQACARYGSELLHKKRVGRHTWRAEGSQPSEVMPPIPGVMLALAVVECSPEEGPVFERRGADHSMQDFARMMGAVFSTAQEVPSVTVGWPLPYYSATERAFSGQIRHLAGRSGPASRQTGAEPVQVDVLPVKRGQAARIVLSSVSDHGGSYAEPICSWDLEWSWRTTDSLVRASDRARKRSQEDDYWVSVQGQFLGGMRH